MARRRVSNQNLKSIFDDNSFDEDEESISTLRLTDIEPNKSQPRKNFDTDGVPQKWQALQKFLY